MRLVSIAIGALLVSFLPQPAAAEVTVGGMGYSILSVSRATTVGPSFMTEHASGEFLIIRLTIRNFGDKPATVSGNDFHLKRGETQYDTSSAEMTMEGHFFLDKLNPGVKKTGIIVFDVPANTAPSKYALIVYGNGTSDHREIQL